MVYDITKSESFENLNQWLSDIKEYADDGVQLLLIGNKLDLESQRQVPTERAQEWAQKLDIPFLETSAKDATNVEQAFTRMVEQLLKNRY